MSAFKDLSSVSRGRPLTLELRPFAFNETILAMGNAMRGEQQAYDGSKQVGPQSHSEREGTAMYLFP